MFSNFIEHTVWPCGDQEIIYMVLINMIWFSNAVHYRCIISARNWSNSMNICWTLWILLSWNLSTIASEAIVMNTQPYVSNFMGLANAWHNQALLETVGEQTVKLVVISYDLMLMWYHCNVAISVLSLSYSWTCSAIWPVSTDHNNTLL